MDDRAELMARLDSREALLAAVRGLRADLDGVVAAAGPARLEEPGCAGDWSLKDVIAHLTGWRLVTAARLEAALRGGEPVFPWPDGLTEDDDLDAINDWFTDRGRAMPAAAVLRESAETFDRVERALTLLPDDDLFQPGRFAWLGDWVLGPAVISGTHEHYYEEHAPAIRAWLGA